MNGRWQAVMLFLFGFLGTILVDLAPACALAAPAGDPIAILTEIRVGQAEVRVRVAGEPDWKTPMPLLSLRAGDQVRATGNATAVIMFTGGQGTVTVSAANSPYTLQTPATSAPPGQTQGLVANISRILAGKKKELTYVPLTVRGIRQPPLLLSPRQGKLRGPPVLEWPGSHELRYTLRLFDPQGLVWEQKNLPRAALPYPTTAPPLLPGVSYRWEVEARGFAPQRGQFTILPPEEIVKVRESLDTLAPPTLSGYPRNTVILMRAGFLFGQELYVEAQEELQAAIVADPDEPNLHLMLGHVYERTGLTELAGEEFAQAQSLVSSLRPWAK